MDIREILNEIERICRKHNVREVFLFGSYAVDTQTDTSDIDIIVKGVEDIEGLREEIAEIKTLKRIDIFDYDRCKNRHLLEAMNRDGQKIY